MTRRFSPGMPMLRLIVSLLLVVLAALLAGWPGAARSPIPPPNDTRIPPLSVVGVAGCAANACHHGNGPPGSVGSEYSTWIARDPHARAYRVLFRDDSRRMHETLARFDPELTGLAGAHENPRCLRCHAAGDAAPAVLQADGVGCERCHGPAGNWKSTHYLPGFDRRSPGFLDLRNDLATRARVCVDCHVGAPGMEVDHDLIAAGHPPLRFEFAGYLASYPRHWCDRDREVLGPDEEARAWLIGQLTSARAALELLAFRASENRESWPEFAEHRCAACHHSLQKDSPRQRDDLARAVRGEKVRPGEVPWSSWYRALLPVLARTKAEDRSQPSALLDRLDRLDREMRRPLPPRARVRAEALAAAQLVEGWLKSVCSRRLEPADVRALLTQLAGASDLARAGWDDGSQLYLGLAALHQALGDLDPAFRKRSPLREPLDRMRRTLADSFPPGSRPRYDSPVRYRPDVFLEALDAFRRRLD